MQSQLQSDKVHTQKVVTSFLGKICCVVDKVLPATPYDHDGVITATRIEIAAMAKEAR